MKKIIFYFICAIGLGLFIGLPIVLWVEGGFVNAAPCFVAYGLIFLAYVGVKLYYEIF
jgi:hypothetical protein